MLVRVSRVTVAREMNTPAFVAFERDIRAPSGAREIIMPNDFMRLDPRDSILERFMRWELYFPRPALVRILIVLDNRVSPGPPGSDFGLGRVTSYLRSEPFGFVAFQVDFARYGSTASPTAVVVNNNPGEWGYRYTNFRLNSTVGGRRVIDDYQQVWFFGTEPFVHDNGANTSVTGSPYSPTNAEVAAFSAWMDAGGGVLAMGDHNFLGSAMCWKIPRVGTMRAWRKDANDGRSVPNRSGTDRHDTNQPQNAGQDASVTASPAVIPNSAEMDTVTQPLEWKPYSVWSVIVWRLRNRPHPVLCGGSLGVIDRFPDHPHEGLVVHEDLIDFSRKCEHDSRRDEYPTVGGVQPRAEVIAWVKALPSPPYRFGKGVQPGRRIPAIGVYDGHAIAHGRVLVDSTWHHWFDMNIASLEAANTSDFQKIRRYFQNVAIWLSPPSSQQRMLNYAAVWAVFTPSAIEGLTIDLPVYVLGGHAIDILGRSTSDCLVTSWVLGQFELPIRELIRPPIGPEPIWSSPPEEIFTQAIMGGVIRQLLPLRDELLKEAWRSDGKLAKVPFDPKQLDVLVEKGVAEGFRLAIELLEKNRVSFERTLEATKLLAKAIPKPSKPTASPKPRAKSPARAKSTSKKRSASKGKGKGAR